ncbi:Scytalone dehydratase [Penicillium sp. CMV-2018d]|nr:Scytalone dehydratase [Penicillium sp. CMV-2018d]
MIKKCNLDVSKPIVTALLNDCIDDTVVPHQKYGDDALSEVLVKGHAHGNATIQYRRVEGEWKFAGLEPDIRWKEHDVDGIFHA